MKKIAITGGIGSGKSTLLVHLQKKGYPVLSCDEIYKEIIVDPAYIQKIREVFPDCVENGKINRAKLGTLVFQNAEERKKLNAIAHPLIIQRMTERMEESSGDFVFAEVPLLFEGGFENRFDSVWVVLRSKEKRVKALTVRDSHDEAYIQKQISSQFDYEGEIGVSRMKKCNATIFRNEGSEKEFQQKVDAALDDLLASL